MLMMILMFNQVDLEINGEPIEIQMKLDDSGIAFFVEDLESNEDDNLGEYETSPMVQKSSYDSTLPSEEIEIDSSVLESYFSLAPENVPDECGVGGSKTDLEKDQSISKGKSKPRLRVGELLSRRSLTEAFLNIETLTNDTDDMFDMDDMNILDHKHA